MPARARGAAMLGAVILATGVSGCASDEVPIEATAPESGQARERCEAVVEALPDTLAGEERRPVDPDDALGAAYGDPPITLTCGGPLPEGFDEFSACEVGNDVGWFAPEDQVGDPDSELVMTAVEYRPVVQVRVPATYRPSGIASLMVDLAPIISEELRLVAPCR